MTVGKSIQKVFISLLNLGYVVTSHLNKRAREWLVFILIFCTIFFINATRSPVLRDPYIYYFFRSNFSQYMLCTALFILLTLFSVDRTLKEVEWRKGVFYIGFFLGLAMIIVSFIHPVGGGYRLFGFQMAFLFPAFYLVWNNRKDYDVLFSYVSYAMIIVGIIFFVITLVAALKGEMIIAGPRCSGIMSNANCFSLVGLEMYIGVLYLAVTKRITLPKLVFLSVSAGIGIGIMLLGQMRIAILAVLMCGIFTIFFKLRYFREPVNRQKILYALLAFALIIVSIKVTYALVDINNRALQTINLGEVVIDQDTDILDRFSGGDEKGIEQYSSGRTWIWKNYAKHLNFLGNNYENFNKEEMTGPHFGYAHNVFLEMGYRFGVPIAIWYLLYMLICGIICLFYLFARSKTKEQYLIFPIIAAIVFVLESLLDCALLPFFQPEALIYYISIAIVIDRKSAV